jgi:serine/threonine-protein kinase RsbT
MRAAPVGNEELVSIRSDADIVQARLRGRELASTLGFSSTDLVLITTAISELARNILLYARTGEILLQTVHNGEKNGVLLVARDRGPGIANIDLALQAGYSTSGNLGLGLPGVRRLMDEMEIESKVGEGTKVTARKWKR